MKGEGFSYKRALDIVRAGEIDEVLSAFPEWSAEIQTCRDRLTALVSELEREYERLKDIPFQKQFALEAIKTRCPAALFAVRAGHYAGPKNYVLDMRTESLLKVLEFDHYVNHEDLLANRANHLLGEK